MFNVGLMGLGTVGSGVYEIIDSRRENLAELSDKKIQIKKILVRDLNKKRNVKVEDDLLTDRAEEILEDDDIDLVVEAIGGVVEAHRYITSALKRGKHVVTANKAVVAEHFEEFVALSKENKCGFLFEASVGGGIPVVKQLVQNTTHLNDIYSIKGILNGTTNYLLTKMYNENITYDAALASAQEKGYAEADPTDDVEGFDVARKLSILSSIASKGKISVDNIARRGITLILPIDIKVIKSLGFSIKFVGNFKIDENKKYTGIVEPLLVKKDSMFYLVEDVYNLVSMTGSNVGEIQFYGLGAGKWATGNAVVSDVIDVMKGTYNSDYIKFDNKIESTKIKLFEGRYYIRVKNNNNAEKLKKEMERLDVIQNTIEEDKYLIFITKQTSLEDLNYIIPLADSECEEAWYARIED